jgi:uncharacterized protein (TIGR02996 family)
MDTGDALLRAIHAQPADELAWAALGDWLEEKGELERAEMLRLHRALRGEPDGPRRLAWETRVQELLRAGVRPCVPEVVNAVGMRLALIPAGTFWMGSPRNEVGRYEDEPRHPVEITRPFYLGVFTVTQDEYRTVTGTNPSQFAAAGARRDLVAGLDTSRFPVETINWDEAVAFCHALSELPEEKAAGRLYRLPTEAEWEYACRGGASSMTPFAFTTKLTVALANFNPDPSGPSDPPALGRLATVGSYLPNAFGLYDMHGNLWEWCNDWFDEDYYLHSPRQDPPGPPSGERRHARGGTWDQFERRARSADRSSFSADLRDESIGLRVACDWVAGSA